MDSCVFLIFTTRVDPNKRNKHRLKDWIPNCVNRKYRVSKPEKATFSGKHLGNSARFPPLVQTDGSCIVPRAVTHKIPPSVRPLGFVAIYGLVHKWLLLLFVPNPNSVPSLFTPALELRAGPLEDPSQEV